MREAKEALCKAAILIGVPKAIEALLELGEVVDEGAKDDSFVRAGLAGGEWDAEEVRKRGDAGLARIYQNDINAIWNKMGPDMREISQSRSQSTPPRCRLSGRVAFNPANLAPRVGPNS